MASKKRLHLFFHRQHFAADPDKAVFLRLFRRLFLWHTCLMAVFIGLLGLSIGSCVPWLVFVSLEHDLSEQSAHFAQTWQAASDKVCPLAASDHGYMIACYDAHGKLLKAFGMKPGPEEHFVDGVLALKALHNSTSAEDSLDETGTIEVQFDFIFINTASPRMVRYAFVVHSPNSQHVLGVVQVGTTPQETLERRSTIVNYFYISIILAELLGATASGWYLTTRALLPARLAFQRQRDFIANVSHEMRTPLALLRANAEVLLRGRSRMLEEDAELLEDIVAEAMYMDKMTSNMLLLARMDVRQLHLETEVLDLAAVAGGVLRRAQSLARSMEIVLELQEEEKVYVLGDLILLEQAILIVLDNALKYNHSGGKVSIHIFGQDGLGCLRVSDTGIGIAPEHLSRLGERFYRIDKARSREAGGSGLGLSIVRGIVAAHHGKFTLTSLPGQGSSATFSLPA